MKFKITKNDILVLVGLIIISLPKILRSINDMKANLLLGLADIIQAIITAILITAFIKLAVMGIKKLCNMDIDDIDFSE